MNALNTPAAKVINSDNHQPLDSTMVLPDAIDLDALDLALIGGGGSVDVLQ